MPGRDETGIDETGSVLWCVVEQSRVKWETSMVEAKTILLGFRMAKECGETHIMVESDCLIVFKLLGAKHRARLSFSSLLKIFSL